jgi:hypothetical protein
MLAVNCFIAVQDDNGDSTCSPTAGQCCVMKYVIPERVSSFESNQQLSAMTKENTHITTQSV